MTNKSKNLTEQFLSAVNAGQINRVKTLVKQGIDLNQKNDDYFQHTALMSAFHLHRDKVARFLLEEGADVTIRSASGETALHLCPDADLYETIVKAGADINARSNDGTTPLMAAIKSHGASAVSKLLDLGASATVKNDQGATALDLARNKLAFFLKYPNSPRIPEWGGIVARIEKLSAPGSMKTPKP